MTDEYKHLYLGEFHVRRPEKPYYVQSHSDAENRAHDLGLNRGEWKYCRYPDQLRGLEFSKCEKQIFVHFDMPPEIVQNFCER